MLPIPGKDYKPVSVEDHKARLDAFVNRLKGLPPGKYKYNHYFADGVYIRELHLTKGTLAVGVIHLKETALIVTKGSLQIYSEDGLKLCKASQVVVSPAGTQRAAFALEDSVLVTLHRADTYDLDEMVQQLTAHDSDELAGMDEGGYKLYIHGRKVIDEKIQSSGDKLNLKRSVQQLLPDKL